MLLLGDEVAFNVPFWREGDAIFYLTVESQDPEGDKQVNREFYVMID